MNFISSFIRFAEIRLAGTTRAASLEHTDLTDADASEAAIE